MHLWNPIESWRQSRARRRYLPRARTNKTGTIARASLVAVAVILAVSAALELSGGREARALAKALHDHGEPPLDIVERASASRRMVFIADVPGSAEAKRFMADAIEHVSNTVGLDVVGLEVSADEQRFIDLYFSTPTEDAGVLLTRPVALHEGEGVSNSYLGIYRRIRQLNDALPPDRRIRVLALDSENWPPSSAVSPGELARRYGERDADMAKHLQEMLQRAPRARMLVFVNGLSAMRGGGAVLRTGGSRNVDVAWVAARMRALYPQDVYSIMLDASSGGAREVQVVAYRGTAAGPLLEREYRGKAAGTVITPEFAFTRQPIRTVGAPGVSFDFSPHNFALGDVADAYIYLGQ